MTRSVSRPALRHGLAIVLAAGLFAGSGCTPPEEAPAGSHARRNVLLVTLDTVRPDAIGWVAQANRTPNIDRLASEGFRIPHGVAPVPLTLPTHASLLSAQWPRRHGVRDNGQVMPGDIATLATTLKAQGYRTGAVVSGYPLRKPFGLDRGFDLYADDLPEGQEGWLERRAEATTALALGFLDSAGASGEPWFLWVHYYDAHDPYTPPDAFRAPGDSGPLDAYRAEVRYLDHALQPLFARASGAGTVTVVTSDHGEAFGEHGELGHGHFIYDTTTLVPIVFHAPGMLKPGSSDAAPRLIDIGPTVLDLLGLPPMTNIDGVSLRPLLEGREQSIPPAWVETRQPWIAYGWAPLEAWRQADLKLIIAPRPELYDLVADPGETVNLAETRIADADRLELDWLANRDAIPERSSAALSDPAALAKLQSLGYVGSGGTDTEVPPDAADPKDRLDLLLQLNAAEQALRAGEFETAIAGYRKVLETEPDNRMAVVRTGIAYLKQNRLTEALPFLERAVALDPTQPENRFALADALSRTGQVKPAIEQWMETTRLQPRRVAAWSNLGAMLSQDGRLPEAREAMEAARRIEPENVQLLVNLAYLDRALKQPESAIRLLKEAARISPGSFQEASTLGLLLLAHQNAQEAKPWLESARPGQPDFAQAKFQLAIIEAFAGNAAAGREALDAALAADPRLLPLARANPALSGWVPAGR